MLVKVLKIKDFYESCFFSKTTVSTWLETPVWMSGFRLKLSVILILTKIIDQITEIGLW